MSKYRFLIIGGAEKAGTTSLYTYLAAHPVVSASMRKETDFFRADACSLPSYLAEFPAGRGALALAMESSPGYLAEAEMVAPRMAAVVPTARLVFILRDPIDRLRSSFRFYKSRLHVPEPMTLHTFVDRCLAFESGAASASALELKEWHLRSLQRGRYEVALRAFQRHFAQEQLLILSTADLNRDARQTMARICKFAGIDAGFFDSYAFSRENVGFLARNSSVQRLALFFNNRFERLWRRHPRLKQRLLAVYKRYNERKAQPDELSEGQVLRLKTYYAETYGLLSELFPPQAAAAAPQTMKPEAQVRS